MRVYSRIWAQRTAWRRAALLAAVLLAASPARAETLPGPLPARVLKVLDGDTIEVQARIWLGQEITVRVRLDGIDTPELNGKCAAERAGARQAKAFLARAIGGGPVSLSRVRYGKYAGRVLARVAAEDGRDLSEALLGARLARRYDGGRRAAWCAGAG